MRIKILSLITALFCAACSTPQQHNAVLSEKAQAEIQTLHRAYVAAWLRNDTLGVLHTLSREAVLMPSGIRPIAGMTEIKNFWFPNDGSRTVIKDFTATLDELNGNDDLAYLRGRSHLAFTYEKDGSKSALTSEGMFLTIVRRQADRAWRISHQMWGPLKQ